MKKFFLCSAVGIIAIMTSCNKNESEYTSDFQVLTTNLVTNLKTDDVKVSSCSYIIHTSIPAWQATVSTQQLMLGDTYFFFYSSDSDYSSNIYQFNTNGDLKQGQLVTIYTLSALADNQSNLPIDGRNFVVSSLTHYHSLEPGSSYAAPYSPAVVAQYTVGSDYLVKTINNDVVYEGTTITTYPSGADGGESSFVNTKMSYRFVIDIKTNTAKMIIYDARFAEAMPVELAAIVVEGLQVNWLPGSYEIKGENLTPYVYEGTNKVPYEAFTFNSISFEPTNDKLTQAKITYKVAGRYEGTFTGSYLVEPSNTSTVEAD